MAIRCSRCGEELLGAVNRCWRCGAAFTPQPGGDQAPPVRISPALVHAAGAALAPRPDSSLAPSAETVLVGQAPMPVTGSPTQDESVRRGSPFAPGASLLPPAEQGNVASNFPGAAPAAHVGSLVAPALPAYQPSHPAAIAGGVASIMLGVLSMLIGFFTTWSLLTAALGVAMGVWGIYARRRVLALIGIGLCCLALLITGVSAGVRWYWRANGALPFQTIEQPLEEIEQ